MQRAKRRTISGGGQLARAERQPLVQSLDCYACGAHLGKMTTFFSNATAVDVRYSMEDMVKEIISEDIAIGTKVEPEPSFVNAKGRHESGHR